MKILLISVLGLLIAQDIPFFDGNMAYKFLKEQCDIGPRFPGSEGHFKTKNIMKIIY